MKKNSVILSVEKLNKFFVKSGKLSKVLHNINFDVDEGDFFGIIGESGSGKSTTGKCIIRLYDSSSGIISFENRIINQRHIPNDTKHWLTQNMSMIFQDPMSSLNPKKNVLSLISEPLLINKTIHNNVQSLLKKCKDTNPYFQNTFKLQDFRLSEKYLIPFYEENIKLFEDMTIDLENFKIDEQLPEKIFNHLRDVETKYKHSLEKLSTLDEEIKNLLDINHEKINKRQLHVTENDYYWTQLDLKEKVNLLIAPKAYWELKQQLIEKIEKLNAFVDENQFLYHDQNANRLESIKVSLKSEIKAMNQDASLTESITEHIFKLTHAAILKDNLKALNALSNKLYLEIDEIENFVTLISEKIQSKYSKLFKDIQKLIKLSDELDNISLNEKEKSVISDEFGVYNSLYKEIESEYKELNETNFVVEDEDVVEAIKKYNDKSFARESKINEKSLCMQEEILALKKQMTVIKKGSKNEKHIARQKYYDSLSRFRAAAIRRAAFVKKDNHDFKQKIIPCIDVHKSDVAELDNLLYYSQQIFKKTVKNKLKEIAQMYGSKKWSIENFKSIVDNFKNVFTKSEQDAYVNNNLEHVIDQIQLHPHQAKQLIFKGFRIIFNDIKNKIVGLDAINFEQETIKEEISLYRHLRSKWTLGREIYRNSLKMSITRSYVYAALNEVGLKNEHAYRYPHEFSGGQRQRIVIARALISKPKLIIADEPISALDVSIQAQVINIMKDLAKKHKITFIFIAHDLSMVRYVSNRLIIMHRGKIVEKGETNEVFKNPVHPYTKSLIKASPELSKIHVDLSSFSTNMDYDASYSINNVPDFYSVSTENEHFVLATQEQIQKWKK